MPAALAFDLASSRTRDLEDRLHVADVPISKATVSPYWGSEVAGGRSLGLQPDRKYWLYRPPEELRKAAPTFNRLPVLAGDHVRVSAANPQPHLVVGSVGSDARFELPYLKASLAVWDGDAIRAIEDGSQREVSASYAYTPVMEPGVYMGQRYDGRMTDIRGSHVCLVDKGRAGPDVRVSDAAPASPRKETPVPDLADLAASDPKAMLGALQELIDKQDEDYQLFQQLISALRDKLSPEDMASIVSLISSARNMSPAIRGAMAAAYRPDDIEAASAEARSVLGEDRHRYDTASAIRRAALARLGQRTGALADDALPAALAKAKRERLEAATAPSEVDARFPHLSHITGAA